MGVGGIRCCTQCSDEVGMLLCLTQTATLAVHGVLDVQTNGADTEQAIDQSLGVFAVAGLDVDRDRYVDSFGDLLDAGDQLIECDALVVGLANRIRHRVTAHGQRRETGGHGEIRRPRIPHRREDHRISWLVEFEQSGCLACEISHGFYNYARPSGHSIGSHMLDDRTGDVRFLCGLHLTEQSRDPSMPN
ncbi:hypothetical protein W823_02330 [Williamsia sp. D3]|nr:hypothetical protein W823_02330 [Williamsia sp. D3]